MREIKKVAKPQKEKTRNPELGTRIAKFINFAILYNINNKSIIFMKYAG